MTAPVKQQRTCIACRTQVGKGQLIRVVKATDGRVFVDATGKANGRGAYVCSPECFVTALERGRFQAALKCSLSEEAKQELANQANELAMQA